jgi:hypothetical protein
VATLHLSCRTLQWPREPGARKRGSRDPAKQGARTQQKSAHTSTCSDRQSWVCFTCSRASFIPCCASKTLMRVARSSPRSWPTVPLIWLAHSASLSDRVVRGRPMGATTELAGSYQLSKISSCVSSGCRQHTHVKWLLWRHTWRNCVVPGWNFCIVPEWGTAEEPQVRWSHHARARMAGNWGYARVQVTTES